MSLNLNPVQTTITVDGKPCHFVHITLHQTFNNHHTFMIKLDYDQLDVLWMNNPGRITLEIKKRYKSSIYTVFYLATYKITYT